MDDDMARGRWSWGPPEDDADDRGADDTAPLGTSVDEPPTAPPRRAGPAAGPPPARGRARG